MTDFEVTDSLKPDDIAAIKSGIAEAHIGKGGLAYDPHVLGVFARDERGRLIAGLHGQTSWDWLYIDELWVTDTRRGHGLGAQLMQEAEKEARKRGCHSVYLFTQSYGVPGFYQKLGYQKFVTLADCPRGHEQQGFMKRLAA